MKSMLFSSIDTASISYFPYQTPIQNIAKYLTHQQFHIHSTVVWEKFDAKIFCCWPDTTKIERTKYF